MGPRAKKTNRLKPKGMPDFPMKENKMENEKENKYSEDMKMEAQESVKETTTGKYNEKKTFRDQIVSSQSKPEVIERPHGFWSKKLQDLEESITYKKNELYEFSGTDESGSSYKKKKKPKRKTKLQIKKTSVPLHKPIDQIKKVTERKIREIHNQSICREQIMLTKVRKKLADTGKKFTFSTGMPSLGITSTPAAKKDNLVGASNFLFLSPIIVEEPKNFSQINQISPLKSKNIQFDLHTEHHKTPEAQNNSVTEKLNHETPKLETKLKRISCRRVLRSGKVIKI